jgi:hypothetical protein
MVISKTDLKICLVTSKTDLKIWFQGSAGAAGGFQREAVPQDCRLRNGLSRRQGGIHFPQRRGSWDGDLKLEAVGALGFARCLGRFFCVWK